jgi:tetratricopeptide (TPR) repeat protein
VCRKVAEHAFADLRRLADALSALETRTLKAAALRVIDQLTAKLDRLAVPLLVRTLRDGSPVSREAARDALAKLATKPARDRVLEALRTLIAEPASDEVKVCALGLLAELGAPDTATFSDPAAIQRRSALALAAQLETPSEIANAADMMVRGLDDRSVVQMLEVLLEVAPPAAHRLAGELALRLDLDRDQRAKLAAVVSASSIELPPISERVRPTHVAVLVDAAARIVVVATRKHGGERTWRRWAVLIAESGCIEDCLHEDSAPDAADPAATLIANLCADGYRVASSELDHARTLVATAARRTARAHAPLASGYYLGRDLLDLRDAHVIVEHVETPVLAKAVELLATDPAGARALFERCPPEIAITTDWAAGYGACLLALGEHAAAIAPLERAIAAEPTWPLHHWNLAAACHRLGDPRGCQTALRRFIATSAQAASLIDDVDQVARLAHARQLVGELERIARIDRSLARRRSSSTTKRRKKR